MNDTLLDVELVDEEATGNSHRLYLKVGAESAIAEPCIIEAEISAHPYQVMGIAERRDWRVALPAEYTVAPLDRVTSVSSETGAPA